MDNKHHLKKGILAIVIIVIASVILSFSLYIKNYFSDQTVDEMVFYLFNGVGGTSKDVILTGIKKSLFPFFMILLALLLPICRFKDRINMIEMNVNRKKLHFSIFPNKTLYKYRFSYSVIVLVLSLFAGYHLIGVKQYVASLTDYSTFIEENYAGGADVNLTFPEQKRNLIILYMESMENSFISKENGGGWEYPVIPELENLALEHINFSNTEKIGGAYQVEGTGWTVAGIVSTTTGLPLKIPINGNEYTSSDQFLAGAYALGDVLKEAGYNLEFMAGSDANFGGRSNYFKKHGDYKIFDVNTAIEQGKMDESDRVWWGFDDTHLFTWAKEEIIELAEQGEPFNFTFLTANTHFQDGYLEEEAEEIYGTQYENVYVHSSKQVAEFIEWLQQQPFYENTTLVILGDHLSMQDPKFFEEHLSDEYERTIYNVFINSVATPVQEKNRTFTSLDMYPTILASIGVQIEGERLGLGTNLFSGEKTLTEEHKFNFVNEELAKNSNFYNSNILRDDYLYLLEQTEETNQES